MLVLSIMLFFRINYENVGYDRVYLRIQQIAKYFTEKQFC